MSELQPADPIHELLPWFVAGTLPPDEAEAFRRHLPSCAECRDELAELEALRAEIERHGEDFLADHPSAERLVAAVRGALDADDASTVRRHLALCPTCATEARWVRGEATASGVTMPPRPVAAAAPARPWLWSLAAAAAVFLLMLPLALRNAPGPAAIVVPSTVYVAGPERDGAAPTYDLVDDGPVSLMFEIDLAPAAFPATFELRTASGKTLARRAGIRQQNLASGVYLALPCPRTVCTDGSYVGVIIPSAESGEADIEISFSLRSD